MIPIHVAVTGHRDLATEELPLLRRRLGAVLAHLRRLYPHSDIHVLTGLAEGADQLAADFVLESRLPRVFLWGIAPMPVEEYRRDFTGAALERFDGLWSRCHRTWELGWTNPERAPSRLAQYEQLAAWLCYHSQVLLAFWNGHDNGKAEGTAAVVRFQLEGTGRFRDDVAAELDYPDLGQVYWIPTHRSREVAEPFHETPQPGIACHVARFREGVRVLYPRRWTSLEQAASFFAQSLATIDRLNRRWVAGLSAGALAERYKPRHWWSIVTLLLVGGVGIVFHSAFSNVVPSKLLLLGYLLFFALTAGVWGAIRALHWDEAFYLFRTLENLQRVGRYWFQAGVRRRVSESIPRRYRGELDWAVQALRMLEPQPWPASRTSRDDTAVAETLNAWISSDEGQLRYYERSVDTRKRSIRWLKVTASVLAVASFAWTSAALLVPAWSGDTLWSQVFSGRDNLANWWNFAADLPLVVAALLGSWLQVRAFEGELAGAQRMLRTFRFADEARGHGRDLTIVEALGEECLNEYAEWLVDHRKNVAPLPF